LGEEAFFWEPVGLEFAGGDCFEPCEDEGDDNCEEPFLLNYDEGDAVTFGGFTAVVTTGDTRIVGGSINDRNAYVASLNPDGSINWQHYLDFQDDAFETTQAVFDLKIDEEGMIVGITGSSQGEGFVRRASVFKIAPESGDLIWHQTLSGDVTGGGFSFQNVFAPAGNPNYLVSGASFSGGAEAVLFRFDRSTGALQDDVVNAYSANLQAGFVDAVLDPESGILYTVGDRINASGDLTVVITAIDISDNDVVWSRTYHRTSPVETELSAASIALLGGKVYALATAGTGQFSTFYLIDTDLVDPVSGVYRYEGPADAYRFGELASRDNELVLTAGQSDRGTNNLEVRPDRITVAGQRFFVGAVLWGEGASTRFPACMPDVITTQYDRSFQTFTYDDLSPQEIDQTVLSPATAPGISIPGNLLLSRRFRRLRRSRPGQRLLLPQRSPKALWNRHHTLWRDIDFRSSTGKLTVSVYQSKRCDQRYPQRIPGSISL